MSSTGHGGPGTLSIVERVLDMCAADLASERPPATSEDVHFTRAFVRAVLEEFSSPGDVVLDPFAGYGTTLLVGKELGREPIGIELLPERAASIRARLGSVGRVIEGDARMLDRFGLGTVDVCLTSPPYMTRLTIRRTHSRRTRPWTATMRPTSRNSWTCFSR